MLIRIPPTHKRFSTQDQPKSIWDGVMYERGYDDIREDDYDYSSGENGGWTD